MIHNTMSIHFSEPFFILEAREGSPLLDVLLRRVIGTLKVLNTAGVPYEIASLSVLTLNIPTIALFANNVSV